MAHDPSRILDRPFQGFLFDMDGTLLNSIAAVERVWGGWAARHGLDAAEFLPRMHGRRGIDTIRDLALPGVDVDAAAAEIEKAEIANVDGVVALPGAAAFLNSLPPDRWAVVTSAALALAKARITAAGLPLPRHIVSAEDVVHGKPDPAGYLLGAERIGADPARCLVFEDVLPGVMAGEAAGAAVVVVTATHKGHGLESAHPTLSSYEGLRVIIDETQSMQIIRAA